MGRTVRERDLTGKAAPFPLRKFQRYSSYLKVQSRDFGRIKFKLLGSQKYILDEVVAGLKQGITTFVVLKGRQVGATTLFIIIDMMYAFEYEGLQGTFILHEEKALDRWRAIIDIFLETLPPKIRDGGQVFKFRPETVRHSRNLLWFENDSMFTYLIAGTAENKSGGGFGRSGATNFVHGTECAMYGSEEDIAQFKAQISSIYPHRLQVWESTAKGFNHWYETCQTAKESPTMKYIFCGWWRNELFQLHIKDPRYKAHMPEERLTQDEKRRVRAVLDQYGFQISFQQVAWWRWKKNDEFANDDVMMDQEFPWTDTDAFQSGKSVFFEGSTITNLMRHAVKAGYEGYRYRITNRWDETDVIGPLADPRSELHVWEHSSQFGYYVIGCDPAYGSSDRADWNVISVWRCYAECIVQVAEFCSKKYSTYNTAWVIAHLAGFYGRNDCRVNIEMNGPGTAVFAELKNLRQHMAEMQPRDDAYGIRNCLRNMHDYYYSRVDSVSGGELAYHTKMHEDIRRHLVSQFKDGIELGKMIPKSMTLLEEMRKLSNDEGHVSAAEGHDDHVMAAALAYETWVKWMAPRMRSMHMTRARSEEIEARGSDKPITKAIINYLRKSNITLPTG